MAVPAVRPSSVVFERDEAVALPVTPRGPAPSTASARAESDAPSFAQVFAHVVHQGEIGSRLMDDALGRAAKAPLDGQHLLALQVGVYRYSESIDLAAKIVDRTAQAVKTVLSGS
jgi:hypothetical protein